MPRIRIPPARGRAFVINFFHFLQQEFDPAPVTHLARLAGLAREEEIFWHALEDERFAALASREPSGGGPRSVLPICYPRFRCSRQASRDAEPRGGSAATARAGIGRVAWCGGFLLSCGGAVNN